LFNWAKTLDPTGKTSKVVELLNIKNPILADIPYLEGNTPTGHRASVRVGLPAVAWRLFNQGIPPTTSVEAQIDYASGLLEAWSEVDCELARLNGNTFEFRAMKAKAHLESMAQEAASTLFYGNGKVTPAEFTGLSPFYSSKSAQSGQNILDAGGTGVDNMSIWLIGWSTETVHGIFPKGSKAGLDHRDLGEGVAELTAGIGGSRMLVYRDQFTWKMGLALIDWRYCVRAANISKAALVADNNSPDIIKLLSRMLDRIPDDSGVNLTFYCNRTLFSWLRIQALAKSNNILAIVDALDQFGNPVTNRKRMEFDGIPIKRCDALLTSESQVT
jgi:hypothetical protein